MCWFCLFQWVQEDSPTHATSTPVKIDSALQFVPKNTNPREFKKLQQQVMFAFSNFHAQFQFFKKPNVILYSVVLG